jgi:HrpA-like RNA helicase
MTSFTLGDILVFLTGQEEIETAGKIMMMLVDINADIISLIINHV